MGDFVRLQDLRFSLRDRDVLRSLDCERDILTPKTALRKIRDCETLRTAQRTRLRDL